MAAKGAVGIVVFALVLVVAAVVGLILWVAPDHAVVIPSIDPVRNTEVIGRVGNFEITRFHLTMKRETEKAKSGEPDKIMPDHGLFRELLDSAIEEEILRKYKFEITPDLLAKERARVDKETMEPERLAKMQRVCAPYPGIYDRVVLRPLITNRMIYQLLNFNEEIQAEAYAKARAIYERAKQDPTYLAVEGAGQPSGAYQKFSPNVLPPREPPGSEEMHRRRMRDFIKAKLDRVAPGGVILLDEMGGLAIVRLISRDGEDGEYEILSVPKRTHDSWMREQLKSIRFEVLDPAIRKELMEKGKGNPVLDRLIELQNGK